MSAFHRYLQFNCLQGGIEVWKRSFLFVPIAIGMKFDI